MKFDVIRTQLKTLRPEGLSYRTLLLRCLGRTAELRENLFLSEDQQFFAIDFDFAAAVLAEQHAVADVDVEGDALALLALARTDGDHFALLRFLFCRVRDDDAALDGFLLFNALHDHTVVQRGEIDCHLRKTSIGDLTVRLENRMVEESRNGV